MPWEEGEGQYARVGERRIEESHGGREAAVSKFWVLIAYYLFEDL